MSLSHHALVEAGERLPTGPAVQVVDLTKTFVRKVARGSRRGGGGGAGGAAGRRVAALDEVTFAVRRGETIAVLGQNGSGKSTLVRILSTLLLPDGGEARVLGHDVVREPHAVQCVVNRVSVEASFFKKMSATENLSYAARFYGMSGRRTRQAIPEILDRVGFPLSRRGEPMENLSRGMQQKVALARALLTTPVVLLLDEPTTGLDPRSKRDVQAFIREVRTTHDSTIILCTHDLAEAEALADRVGILDRGRLLALEPAADLVDRYRSATLEDAFFAATGRDLDPDAVDDEREVFG
jgi:ABC-2 type transport system ATP-binding protein